MDSLGGTSEFSSPREEADWQEKEELGKVSTGKAKREGKHSNQNSLNSPEVK